MSAASSANRAIAPAAPAHYLRLGSQGPDVVRVQSALAQAPDGIFGSRTDAAVRIFQARNGLASDGIVGPKTWGVLFGPHGVSYDPATPQFQFKIQRASRTEEARIRPALAGHGPVAKIVLHTTPRSGGDSSASGGAGGSIGGGHQQASTTPAVDTTGPAPGQGSTAPVSAPSTPVSTSCGSSRIVAPVKNYVVTGVFGEQRPGHLHAGIDLAVPYGTPIVAAACGIVTTAESQSGYGNIVCVKHSSSLTTCYAHMSRFASRVGQHVHQGQVIGYVGTTGDATGPHVHFETRVNGSPTNPAPYLSGARRARVTVHSSSASNSTRTSTTSAKPASSSGGSRQSTTVHAAKQPEAQPQQQSQPQADTSAPPQQEQQSAPAPQPAPAAQQSAPAPQPAPAQAPAAQQQAAPAPDPAPAPAEPQQQAPAPAPAPDPAPAPAAAAPDPQPATPAPAPAEAQAPAPAPAAAPQPAAPTPEPAAPAAAAQPSEPAAPAAPAEPAASAAPAEPAAPAAAASATGN